MFFFSIAPKWAFGEPSDNSSEKQLLWHDRPHGRGMDSVHRIRLKDQGYLRGCSHSCITLCFEDEFSDDEEAICFGDSGFQDSQPFD